MVAVSRVIRSRLIRMAALVTLLTIPFSAQAQAVDYRQEIMTEVIHPCYRAIMRHKGGIVGVTEDEALELLLLMQAKNVEIMVATIRPLVSGKQRKARELLYQLGLRQCISGGTGGG